MAGIDRRGFLASAGAAAMAASPYAVPLAWSAQTDPYDALLEQVLALSPETATSSGLDKGKRAGLKHRLDDRSGGRRLSFYEAVIDAAPRLRASAPPADIRAASYRETVLWLADTMRPFRGFRYGAVGGYSYPVPYVLSQLSGLYQSLPDFLVSQHTITGADDAEAVLDRMAAASRVIDDETEQMRRDSAVGAVAPDFLLDRTIRQLTQFQASQQGAAGGMVASLANRAGALGLAGDWRRRAQAITDGPMAAAIARQLAAVEQLRLRARSSAGVGALPDGDAYYAACLRFHTSTDLTPDAAHQLGLQQVAEISARARVVLDARGVTRGTVAEGIKALWSDPAEQFPNTDEGRRQVLAFISDRLADMTRRLPQAFSHLPKTPLEVRRVPPDTELGAPGAYSQSGSIDGTRPGAIYFNLADTANWPRWAIPTTAYHEGLPGHHFAGSIANETRGVPDLFKLLGFNAYNEGWALYAEQLADELGVYDDLPLGRLGMLQGSLFRACRIVVDTGMHARGWSREKAIAYLVETCGSTADDARREIERYCAWPGQACGYKIGHLELLRLRQRARLAMGARFDLKGFHDTLLNRGAQPLAVVGAAVDAWIAGRA
jgi:uncharacterized protein (DUF885 family)